MKRCKKWLTCLLAVVMAVSCLCVPAMAVETEKVPAVQLTTADWYEEGSQVEVAINALVSGMVADGRLTVKYDADKLSYASAELDSTWAEQAKTVLSVNTDVPGQVTLAFAGTEAVDAGAFITVCFNSVAGGTTTISLAGEAGGDYISGLNTGDGGYTLAAEVSTAIGDLYSPVPGGWPSDDSEIPDDDTPTGGQPGDKCDGGADCPSHNFTDVSVDSIYHEGIDFMVKNGYMNGVSATSFAPTMTMNRGMIVTILYRMSGAPAVTGSNPFTDVKSTDYCYDAVRWAVESGITKGVSATEFNPNGLLTRQEIAAFLYRYAELVGYDTTKSGNIQLYQDADQVFDWAQDAMKWAVGSEIIKGASATQLKPADNATREQIAVMVWRLVTANQG
ncbi:S-layer homology domain-containing protein [Pseudoflavonifractor intestinihominis]|uniref:S-layer homology domain-containing protein n=1 Tax=Pseudoflavonifractor intestinihominis TaxID=3133171 RepID=A0ABV1EF15_9FIRM|nr:S-layer homology domain-containing protein [uncultured Pseudoflavonifractor sp.]